MFLDFSNSVFTFKKGDCVFIHREAATPNGVEEVVADLKDSLVTSVDICVSDDTMENLLRKNLTLTQIEELEPMMYDFLDEVYHRTSEDEFKKLRFMVWDEYGIEDVLYADRFLPEIPRKRRKRRKAA